MSRADRAEVKATLLGVLAAIFHLERGVVSVDSHAVSSLVLSRADRDAATAQVAVTADHDSLRAAK